MISITNKPTLTGTSASEKVNEIMEKVKMKSSIIANEELVREGNPESQMIGVLHRMSKITNSIAIVSSSDSIIGKPPETFVEEIQCNLYEEIKAEIEARMEEEMVDKPKDKERNYGYLKKVS